MDGWVLFFCWNDDDEGYINTSGGWGTQIAEEGRRWPVSVSSHRPTYQILCITLRSSLRELLWCVVGTGRNGPARRPLDRSSSRRSRGRRSRRRDPSPVALSCFGTPRARGRIDLWEVWALKMDTHLSYFPDCGSFFIWRSFSFACISIALFARHVSFKFSFIHQSGWLMLVSSMDQFFHEIKFWGLIFHI